MPSLNLLRYQCDWQPLWSCLVVFGCCVDLFLHDGALRHEIDTLAAAPMRQPHWDPLLPPAAASCRLESAGPWVGDPPLAVLPLSATAKGGLYVL